MQCTLHFKHLNFRGTVRDMPGHVPRHVAACHGKACALGLGLRLRWSFCRDMPRHVGVRVRVAVELFAAACRGQCHENVK